MRKDIIRETSIYGLFDPFTGVIKYVGKSSCLTLRYYSHCNMPEHSIDAWVTRLYLLGQTPVMKELYKCKSENEAKAKEIELIAFYSLDYNLLNRAQNKDYKRPIPNKIQLLKTN